MILVDNTSYLNAQGIGEDGIPVRRASERKKKATHVSSCSTDCSPCIRNYCSFTGTKKQWFVLMAIFIFPFTLDNDI